MKDQGARITIYKVDFGSLDIDLDHRLGAIKSIRDNLNKVIGKFIHYGSTIFSKTHTE